MQISSDYRELIQHYYSRLGKRKKVLADKILAAPLEVIGMSIGKLAQCCDCDQTTIVRFAQQLGYSGYPELKLAIAQKADVLWKAKQRENLKQTAYQGLCSQLSEMYDECINKTMLQISEDTIQNVVSKINDASTVMICGSASSSLAAEDLSIKLTRLGVKVLFFRDQEMWKSFVGILGQQDVLIAFSNFGETPGIVELLKGLAPKGVCRIGITSAQESSVWKNSDIRLNTNSNGELPVRIGAMGSRISQMVVVDLITMVFSEIDKERSWKLLEQTYVSYTP